MSNPLVIIGAGGFAREVAWLASRTGSYEVVAFVEDSPRDALHGVPVMNFTDAAQRHPGVRTVTAVGSPTVRKLLRERALALGFTEATLIDPDARIGHRVHLGPGAVICAGVVMTVDAQIGAAAQVNLNATVGHDASWGDYVTVSPGVNLSGWVAIDEGGFLGTGAQVIEGRPDAHLTIGAWSTVAAGACVIRDVAPGTLVAGVPAQAKVRS